MEDKKEEIKNDEKPKEEKTEPVDEAKASLEAMKKQNAELEAELKKRDELLGKLKLGGRTAAGTTAPVVVEETPQEYAKRIIRGGK
jgi:membrane protein involved in colicin uptake